MSRIDAFKARIFGDLFTPRGLMFLAQPWVLGTAWRATAPQDEELKSTMLGMKSHRSKADLHTGLWCTGSPGQGEGVFLRPALPGGQWEGLGSCCLPAKGPALSMQGCRPWC